MLGVEVRRWRLAPPLQLYCCADGAGRFTSPRHTGCVITMAQNPVLTPRVALELTLKKSPYFY